MFDQKFFTNCATTMLVYGFTYSKLYPSTPPDDVLPASKELSERVNQQARAMGVEQPIKVYTSKNNLGEMRGVNGPGKWNSMTMILPQKAEKGYNRFVMSHEIAHAKNNDILIHHLNCLAAFHLSFFSPSILFSFVMAGVVIAYARYAENRADITAATYTKNIEIAGAIEMFSNLQSANLFYRNLPSKHLWDHAIKKLTVSSTGDNLFTSTFPFFDHHPSHTSRIDYLTKFIKQRPDSDPLIEVFYQAHENGPLEPIQITDEQSSLLRKIIKDSPKEEYYNSLGKIMLCIENSIGIVKLFKYGQSDDFAPYNFKSAVAPDLLPAIIETIMHNPKTQFMGIKVENIDDIPELKNELKERWFKDMEQVDAIKVDDEENLFIFYDGKPLDLISNKRFEALGNTEKTRPSLEHSLGL